MLLPIMSRDGHFELGDLPARNRAHLERNPANGQISRYACSNDSKQPYCLFVYQRVCLPASRLIVVPVISVVLFGTFMFDIDDVLGQQDFLYPAQVADLREFAQATEAGKSHAATNSSSTGDRRVDLYGQFEQAAPLAAPYSPVPPPQ